MFEFGSHPEYSSERAISSLRLLDSIIAALYPSYAHVNDASTFLISPFSFPRHPNIRPGNESSSSLTTTLAPVPTLPNPNVGSTTVAANLEWNASWTPSEVLREEIRRISWAALLLGVGHLGFNTRSAQYISGLNLFKASKVCYTG